MSTRLFFIITFIGLIAIVANGVKSTMNLASYLNDQPKVSVQAPLEAKKSNKPQQRISDYVADNPRHGCIPQPAFIDFDLGKHGEWIKLESFEDLQDEYDRQWGLLNCEGFETAKYFCAQK